MTATPTTSLGFLDMMLAGRTALPLWQAAGAPALARPPAAGGPFRPLSAALRGIWARRAEHRARRLAMARLAGTSAHLLEDIGIEGWRFVEPGPDPVWDAPGHWRRRV